MAFSLRQTVYYLSSLCAVIVPLYGEQFFRDRYHKDQSLYQNNLHVYSVRSRQEAMKQLEKYGYLECRISRRKREAPFPGVIAESQGSNSRMKPVPGVVVVEQGGTVTICNETQLREGIVRYQNKYHLNLTGILDDDTLRFMSNSRCGNKDSEEELVNPDLEKSPEMTQDETGSKQNRQKRSLSDNPSGADRISMTRPWRWSPRGSRLMNLIAPKETKNPALERRQQILQEYIDKLDKDDPRIYKPVTELERKKRSIVVNNRTGTAEMFQKKLLKWRLLNSGYSTRIPVQDQRATIDLAFRMWSEVIPLKFKEDVDCEIQEIDIEIAFGRGSHQNCPKTFDGYGGEVAHSWHAGDVHFDDEENYKSVKTYTVDGLYLLKVAVHEIGHVLGLAHTNKSYSIMYAIYHKHYSPQPDFELGWEDRKEVQKLYGVCKGSFNIVFDWVRKRANNQFIYNTYFFRGNRYWMYENHANRTRFGDPLFIEIEWTTLPGNLDGYVHVWYYSKRTGVVNEAYFFKGEHYYKYDSDNDRVLDGWPRLIRTDFAAKNSSMEPIPVNIDTVYFDMRDKNIYFFKGSKVYVYDPKEPEEARGCCERIVDIREEYPAKPGAKGTLPDNLDSVYYSYKDFSMYFIKGEDVWKNELFRSRDKEIRNRVVYENKWYGKWYDICDWISDTDVDAIV